MGELARRPPERPRPQPGPQTTLDQTIADIAVYGGGAGTGKSVGLLHSAGKWTQVKGIRGYRAVLFRRTNPELLGGGGLWDKSQTIYRAWSGRPRSSELDWIFEASTGLLEDRHRIEFRQMQRESDAYDHSGRDYDFIGFDELQTFTAKQFWFMVSRLRSTSGVRPHLRATCNPDPDSFVAKLIEWWIGPDGYPIPERSGAVRWFIRDADTDTIHWFDTEEEANAAARELDPEGEDGEGYLSLTFIAGRLSDNSALLRADPSYRSRLRALTRVDRLRLLGDRGDDGKERGGNWRVRESAGMFFRRSDFVVANDPPSRPIRTVRAWDKAASAPTPKHPNPDWTRGIRVSLCEGGELWIDGLESLQAGPVDVLKLMLATAANDGVLTTIALWQDTGGAGKTDAEVTADALAAYVVALVDSFSADAGGAKPKTGSSRAKRAFARVWAPLVEQGRVYVKRAEWTDELVAECDVFPEGRFDDIVDAISLAAQVLIGQGMGFWGQLKAAADRLEGEG